jgi:hypothetical protein
VITAKIPLAARGWGKLNGKDNPRCVKACGRHRRWGGALAYEQGRDADRRRQNWPVEVAPSPDKRLSLPVHQIALVVDGIHLLQNPKLDELAASNASEFAFIIQGGSGLTVSPIAVR